MEHVQTQLRYVEEDKARLDIKLVNSNKDLEDIKNNLDGEMKRRKACTKLIDKSTAERFFIFSF